VAKSAKSPSNQLKEGRSTAGTACPSTGNLGSDLTKLFLFFLAIHVGQFLKSPFSKPYSGRFAYKPV
jgi:hypothetical protein